MTSQLTGYIYAYSRPGDIVQSGSVQNIGGKNELQIEGKRAAITPETQGAAIGVEKAVNRRFTAFSSCSYQSPSGDTDKIDWTSLSAINCHRPAVNWERVVSV